MKRARTLTLTAAPASTLAWALLLAEAATAVFLFSFDRVPSFLVRSLQLFLRF